MSTVKQSSLPEQQELVRPQVNVASKIIQFPGAPTHQQQVPAEQEMIATRAAENVHPVVLMIVFLMGIGMWGGLFYLASIILNILL